MTRNFKVLGLALVAMLAMTAVVSSAAQAEKLTNPAGTKFLVKGTQEGNHKFVIGGNRTLQCPGATFQQTLPTGAVEASSYSSMTMSPTFGPCTIEVLGNTFDATVTRENCDYNFSTPTSTIGKVDVKCTPSGGGFVIHVFNATEAVHEKATEICTYTVGEQTGLEKATFVNDSFGIDTIQLSATVSNVSVSKTFGTLAACGAASQTSTYTGNTRLKGFNAGTQVDIHLKP